MEPVIATKLKIRMDNSDGTFAEYETPIPKVVADKILLKAMTWDENCLFTAKEHRSFEDEKSKILDK